MTFCTRPHFGRFPGHRAPSAGPRYPYPNAMLTGRDILDLFVLDGGAFFFTNEHLGGKSTRRFIGAFESGELLAPWTGGKRHPAPHARDINWFGVYDPEKGPWAPGQTIERHVWLHRLYFLLPIAQQYYRTGRRIWARRWCDFFFDWRSRFPAMGDPLVGRARLTAWIWHDMQVAWRLLVLIHSVHLLGSRRGAKSPLSPDEWRELYRAIAVHAKWVHAEARAELAKSGTGNHFLQKGMALLWAGLLFPELEEAGDWVATGRRVIRDQMRREINADGGSVEASPSYSHFIARIYLDAYLILAANGRPPIPGLANVIRRQYSFLAETMSPSGHALQVGDSYALDAKADLAIARRLIPLAAAASRKSICLAPSRVVVLRSPRTAVYIDAMDVRCGHTHTGKPNVLIYHCGQPVVIDSGCINYDQPEWRRHFRSWAAHNVVVVEPFLKDQAAGREIRLSLSRCALRKDGGKAEFVCRYAGKDARFVWRRTVTLAGDRVEITDRLASPRRTACTLALHLAPSRLTRAGGRTLIARAEGWRLTFQCSGTKGPLACKAALQPAIDESNRRFMAPAITCRQTGRQVEFRATLRFS